MLDGFPFFMIFSTLISTNLFRTGGSIVHGLLPLLVKVAVTVFVHLAVLYSVTGSTQIFGAMRPFGSPLFVVLLVTLVESEDLHLTTDDEGSLTVIQGFATQLMCALNTCSPNVVWYKDDYLLFNGTQFIKSPSIDEKSYKLHHKVDVDYEKGCSGICDDSTPCQFGTACVDNQCCACSREEFTLILRNLTFEDSGQYKCQIENQSELLEFKVEVIESGLKGGFHENISYDHSECCQKKGISPLCRAMCKPNEMGEHHFDPTSCKTDDYKNFLSCATDNGNRSHVHCCKTQLVPSFCYDFCSGDFQMLRRSHRLCLYYLPEIFECYNRAYLPYPDPPDEVTVNAVEHDKLSVCWRPPVVHESNKNFPVVDYTVFYKEIPNFPLMTGELGIPLLNSDYSDFGDIDDADYSDVENENIPEAPRVRARRVANGALQLTIPGGANIAEIEEIMKVISVRRKRAIVMTRDEGSNSSIIREFNFQQINTTSTCQTISDLRSATRYIVYVTARNEYGTSVPSIRNIASTNVHKVKNNGSIPDAMQCCKENVVSSYCSSKMCNVEVDPSAFATISIATTCRSEWPKVSPCIADQRNHTDCCLRKGVQSDCLKICSGSTAPLGVHSVLCLNLDLQAIYQCLREGYESHPSAPVNVSVHSITETSAVMVWEEPEANAHLVETYTLFIRKSEHGAAVRQVHNAVSPHTEIGLDSDSEYSVSVQSNSAKGTSLPSTAILFSTRPAGTGICKIGEPLLISEERPFLCNAFNPCPTGYSCTDVEDEAYCCQKESLHSDADFQTCCMQQNVTERCMQFCYYNASLSEDCRGELNKWVQCAAAGYDYSKCCEEERLPKQCITGCRHPFQVPDECFLEIHILNICFSGDQRGLPLSVRNLKVTQIESDSATLSWEDLDLGITMYNIELLAGNSLVNNSNVTKDSIHFDNLSPSTEYHVKVIAFNEIGAGPPSFSVTFTTLPRKFIDGDTPKAPEGIKIVWNFGNRVNVTWNPVIKRRDGNYIEGKLQYTVYYVDSDKTKQWTALTTNNSWVVLKDLRYDALYSVYVTCTEMNKTSKSSSVITILAHSDSYGLPEPVIRLFPDKDDGIYNPGEKILINCSVTADVTRGHLNIDLTSGAHTEHNDHGIPWVFLTIETSSNSSMEPVRCAVTDTDGRQNIAMRHIQVKFGPFVNMLRKKVRAFDDKSADLICEVVGFPTPTIRFEKDQEKVIDEFKIQLTAINTYRAILHIRNVTGRAGIYSCIAENNGVRSTTKSELIISKKLLPVNPRLIISCCEDKKIDGECLQACTIGKAPSVGDCSQYATSLLSCASDVHDHSDCCASQGVPGKCLRYCSGDVVSADNECHSYAVSIMGCFVRGHEHSPQPVNNIVYEVPENGKIKLKWKDPSADDSYIYYAVYYKKKDDDQYMVENVTSRTVELLVEPDALYEVGVISANAFGHSPFVYLDIPTANNNIKKSSGVSSAFYIIVLLLACGFVTVGIIYLGRRRDLPAPFGKLVRRQAPINQPSVAFENPAYVSGNEVEIRGLGFGQEWQSQDLQASSNNEAEYRNGMRYAKLDS